MPKAKDMDIDVVITNKPGGGGYDFALDANNGKGSVQEVKFENDRHPGVMVYFNIRDVAQSGLTFEPSPDKALWVTPPKGPTAPPPACPNGAAPWDGFVPLSVEQDKNGKNTQLIAYFSNWNSNKGKCTFALRFVDSSGKSVPYDPIGDGANGLRQ